MSSNKVWRDDELTCKPIDTYHEIFLFLENPPPWRTLCKGLTPHSKCLIKNIELCYHTTEPTLETPETFCHFDPDTEDIKRHEEKKLPKTMVCHDMANGYHDDSIIDGTGHYDAYTFYNWAGIDIFCYFSHHLITIPPLGWINVGHAHGVKVIGTIITEWAEGIGFWDHVLGSEDDYRTFARALVTIAKTLKFDGWLINIENKVSKPDALLDFIKYFHKALHEELPDPVLVWYDSVTVNGSLNWQNALNEKNKAFFDVCDAFFTNYSWTEKDVSSSAQAAGERVRDLYIGIDVWGRNFYGGGHFNIQEAIKVAYDYGCSLAIFAPAWTHEAINPDSDLRIVGQVEPGDRFERFIVRDRALWDSVWPFLNTRVPCQLPFQTSFCRGQGLKRRLYGEVLCPMPWFNLRHMQYQPNAAHGPHGYIFSTLENIVHVSQKALRRDTAGILKFRESFLASRMELHSTKIKDSKTLNPVEENRSGVIEDHATDEEVAEEEGSGNKRDEQPKDVTRKMKNAFKHLFRRRSQRTDDSGSTEDTAEDEVAEKGDVADKADVGPSWASGRSLMSISVNIKLGDRSERTLWELAAVPEEKECLQLHLNDSFTGGGCLQVNPSDDVCPEHRLTRLFFCDFHCDQSFIVCVVTKTLKEAPDQTLNVVLFMENAKGEDLEVTLIGRRVAHHQALDGNASGTAHLYPVGAPQPEFRELQKYLLLNESGFYVPVENSFNWKVMYFEVPVAGSHVTSINCRTGQAEGPILLGHISVCNRRPEPRYSQDVLGVGAVNAI